MLEPVPEGLAVEEDCEYAVAAKSMRAAIRLNFFIDTPLIVSGPADVLSVFTMWEGEDRNLASELSVKGETRGSNNAE